MDESPQAAQWLLERHIGEHKPLTWRRQHPFFYAASKLRFVPLSVFEKSQLPQRFFAVGSHPGNDHDGVANRV